MTVLPAAPNAAGRASGAFEADRQRALLAAIADGTDAAVLTLLAGPGERSRRGLEAYRANALASARAALEAAFPTVCRLVGSDGFGFLARAFHRQAPPVRGDLGEWGVAFPAWLAARPELAEWPYLEDCAALDLAVHRCERAADTVFDAASLACLERAEPADLRLHLAAGTEVLASRWPIATIHAAHRLADPDFEPVRRRLGAGGGEHVQVVRDGWRAGVRPIDAATFAWTGSLLAGDDLGRALHRAGPHFDFTAWLAAAIAGRWLQGASCGVGAP